MVWTVVSFVLAMLLLGVPGALWVLVRKLRVVLGVGAVWWVAAAVGIVPAGSGPLGFPALVFWPFAVMFCLWWAAGVVLVASSAISKIRWSNDLMTEFGMPASEIF